MILGERMREGGGHLSGGGAIVLMIFLPLLALAARKAEPIERVIGDFWGDLYEVGCIALVLAGLALRAFTGRLRPGENFGAQHPRPGRVVAEHHRDVFGNPKPALPRQLHDIPRRHPLQPGPAAGLGLRTVPRAVLRAHHPRGGSIPSRAFRRHLSELGGGGSRLRAAPPRLAAAGVALFLAHRASARDPTWLAAILSLAAIDIAADFFVHDFNYASDRVVVLGLVGYLILVHARTPHGLLRVVGR